MRNAISWSKRNLEGILAFSLLAWQVWLPWSVPHFATQDGPSHLYNAVVFRELLLHPHSQYSSFYEVARHVIPDWGSTIVLSVLIPLAGLAHAEQLLATFTLALGFFAFAYAIRAFAPKAPRWTPLANFALQTWFLWLGLYSYFLATSFSLLLIGYYVRNATKPTPRRTAALAGGMVVLFLSHLFAGVMAAMVIAGIAFWTNLFVPRFLSHEAIPVGTLMPRIKMVLLAFVPTFLLFAWFARSSQEHIDFKTIRPNLGDMMLLFTTSMGPVGYQMMLFPALLCLIGLAIFTLRRSEWQAVQGGLAVSSAALFLLYLIVPDAALGGLGNKLRFLWGFFILGGLLLATARRFQPFRLPLGIYVFVSLAATLLSTQDMQWKYSKAVDSYLDATKQIPEGARFIRVQYSIPDLLQRYGYGYLSRDSMFHLDGYIAARCRCVDFTDMAADSNNFPIVFRKPLSDLRWQLWSLERAGAKSNQLLKPLRSMLPVDYVILVGDQSTPEPDHFNAVLAQLNSEMRLVGQSGEDPIVRLYQAVRQPKPDTESASSNPLITPR